MSQPARILLAVGALLLGACAHDRDPERIGDLLSHSLLAAQNHHARALDAEAAALLEAVATVDPAYPGLGELRASLDPRAAVGMRRGLLGMNRKLRPEAFRPIWARVLLWLPDRALDLMDVVTFELHTGVGIFADAHATRAVQLAAGARSIDGFGLHDHRSLGMRSQGEVALAAGMAGAQSYASGIVGTSGVYGAADGFAGLHEPGDPLYQSFRDYWAIGASATVGMFGAEFDFHPVQLADFVAGWLGIDFLRDDFAHTRALMLDRVDRQRIAELWRIRRAQ